MAPPHPSVAKQLLEDCEKAGSHIASLPRLGPKSKRYGLNDGAIYPDNSYSEGTPESIKRGAALNKQPLRGKIKVCVVLVDFEDQRFDDEHTKGHFEKLYFGTTGSVQDYYKSASNGLLDIDGKVFGPYTLPHTLEKYANGQSGLGPWSSESPNAQTMAQHAAEKANVEINFQEFDNAGHDGLVEGFIVIHAGRGAETMPHGSDKKGNNIGSHKGLFPHGVYAADGATITTYSTVPEDCALGVCVHELGHQLFGWPDLYDTDDTSQGLGKWCIMAGGTWLGDGKTPAHPSAWCKVQQGWVTVKTLTEGDAIIDDVKTSNTVYKLPLGGTQYLLLENRQKHGFDELLPGPGLLVFHVDDLIKGNSDEYHPQVRLLQADGKENLKFKRVTGANSGDDGDPYPGSSGNSTLSVTSKPSIVPYDSNPPRVGRRLTDTDAPALTNITMKATGKVTLTVKLPAAATDPELPDKECSAAPRLPLAIPIPGLRNQNAASDPPPPAGKPKFDFGAARGLVELVRAIRTLKEIPDVDGGLKGVIAKDRAEIDVLVKVFGLLGGVEDDVTHAIEACKLIGQILPNGNGSTAVN